MRVWLPWKERHREVVFTLQLFSVMPGFLAVITAASRRIAPWDDRLVSSSFLCTTCI